MKDGSLLVGGDAVLHEKRIQVSVKNVVDDRHKIRIAKIVSELKKQKDLIIDEIGLDQHSDSPLNKAAMALEQVMSDLSKI
jgi:hypothetical protein